MDEKNWMKVQYKGIFTLINVNKQYFYLSHFFTIYIKNINVLKISVPITIVRELRNTKEKFLLFKELVIKFSFFVRLINNLKKFYNVSVKSLIYAGCLWTVTIVTRDNSQNLIAYVRIIIAMWIYLITIMAIQLKWTSVMLPL